ncbi:hypothetical protein [Legionella gresilensis]|uniref:hypothetical protein n=1 Tax=Legionella gresilensis TaxID=91823 RepID=UPI0013EF72A0|nr:hypothetical protein [Legionella gresilensis]
MFPVSNLSVKRLILGIVGATLIFFLFGPLALTATTMAVVLRNGLANRALENLISEAIEAKDNKALVKLEGQQILLGYNQKLALLINAYNNQNDSALNWLSRQNFKINFAIFVYLFQFDQEIAFLKLLIERFLDSKNPPDQQALTNLVNYLFNSKAYQLIDTLSTYYPRELLTTIFTFFNFKNPNYNDAYNFLITKKNWLITNRQIVNDALIHSINEKEALLYFLIDIFPNGTLDIGHILVQVISKPVFNQQLSKFLIDYFNKVEKNNSFYQQLFRFLEVALTHKHTEIAEYLLQNNPTFLDLRKEWGTKLLFEYAQNPTITELLLRYGADVNSTMGDGLSLLEKSIGSIFTPVSKKQQMLNIYLQYGVKLDCRLKDAPQNRTDMTLLSYLPFLNLKTTNRAFQSIKLQKFIALFLEIPGISFSNGTVCKHTDMQDPQAFWNFLIDLYFNYSNFNNRRNLPISVVRWLDISLRNLYTEEGNYDAEELYKEYSQGKPIILPIYIKEGWGGSHIATVGFIKNGPNTHLVVEADRGLGRHDFSVFEEKQFNFYQFRQYTDTRLSPILVDKWQRRTTRSLLSINYEAQKDNFCPSISAKFAIIITVFLCIVYQKMSLKPDFITSEKLLATSYQKAINWSNAFFRIAINEMLKDYQNLEEKFIDKQFLSIVKDTLLKSNLFEAVNEKDQPVLSNALLAL